jgi:mono/diheme cytochrome c family protein
MRISLGAALPVALGAAALAAPGWAHAKKWVAPAEAVARVNPVPAGTEAVARGRTLYTEHCEPCHGPRGKGDGPEAKPGHEAPHDLSDPALQQRMTDGEILWKVTEGRSDGGHVLMPGFAEDIPSEEDRWKVVHHVRTLKGSAPAKPHAH